MPFLQKMIFSYHYFGAIVFAYHFASIIFCLSLSALYYASPIISLCHFEWSFLKLYLIGRSVIVLRRAYDCTID